MAIKSLEQRKRQKILLIIAVGLFLAAGIFLYFTLFQGTSPIPGVGVTTQQSSTDQLKGMISEQKLQRIDLDFDFLVETMLPFLKSHGNLPVEKGETGRDNPFIPYWGIISE